MLQLSGGRLPDPDPRYASYPQPPLGAGHLSVEYAPRPAAVREARAAVRRQLEGWGLADQEDLVDTAELLVSELATNAVLHARTPMRVSVLLHDDRVRVEVRDDDPTLPEQRQPDPLSPGGRGIMLVELLARAWGINHNERGKTVWFELEEPTD
jgi:anti-sigma regulatory factor (Ser/Thr protein kinase)